MSGRCRWLDCGWCYAPDGKQANDEGGKCLRPGECRELKDQESNKEAKR